MLEMSKPPGLLGTGGLSHLFLGDRGHQPWLWLFRSESPQWTAGAFQCFGDQAEGIVMVNHIGWSCVGASIRFSDRGPFLSLLNIWGVGGLN
jgi:hypothetical protein